jgi:hypothetical protein
MSSFLVTILDERVFPESKNAMRRQNYLLLKMKNTFASLLFLASYVLASPLVSPRDTTFNSTVATLPSCISPPANSCAFYADCLEGSHTCGPKGYALGYGGKFCQAFANSVAKQEFTAKGQDWVWQVMSCLQHQLIPKLSLQEATCSAIKEYAFDSHPGCYLGDSYPGQPKDVARISLCDLDPRDWITLVKVIGLPTLLEWDTLRNEDATAKGCIKQLLHKIY